jgi:hypothetical protein
MFFRDDNEYEDNFLKKSGNLGDKFIRSETEDKQIK